MSACQTLHDYYSQWRTLSRAEGEAIEAAAWPQVDACQEAKHRLQSDITSVTEAAQTELANQETFDREFRPIIAELIDMEKTNSIRLSGKVAKAEKEQLSLACASRNLRSVRCAYSPVKSAAWNSYS